MSTRNARTKKLRKYDNLGGRRHTVETLNLEKVGENFKVISRHIDPNYCTILFNDCGHEKLVSISGVLKQKPICYDCIDLRLQKEALLIGYELLAKIPHGIGKSRHETRLVRCINCGTFKFLHPSSIKNNARCGICSFNHTAELVEGTKWRILNKNRAHHVLLQCTLCQHTQETQVSNLKRYVPSCRGCNARHTEQSYVYGFIINSEFGRFVKIGKSNNPYLRHLKFSHSSDIVCEFIGKIKFDTQIDAFKFEKELFRRFEKHRISSNIGKNVIDNGWTELFSEEIEEELRIILNE